MQRSCASELEREVYAVLGSVGASEKISRQLADDLLSLEDRGIAEVDEAAEYARIGETTSRKKSWWRLGSSRQDTERGPVWNEEVGLSAFLLKFGEGLGESFMSLILPQISRSILLYS